MPAETLETRVEKLETKMSEFEHQLLTNTPSAPTAKVGWRSFVGVFADSPDFDEVVQIGKEWRSLDRVASSEINE
jgi:hypothetical protein